MASSSLFLDHVSYFDIFGSKSFLLTRWLQEKANCICEASGDIPYANLFLWFLRVIFILSIVVPVVLALYCLSYITGSLCLILSFLFGALADLITGCRFWSRNFEVDAASIELMTQRLPQEFDNELIGSYINQELEKIAEHINSKHKGLLNVSVTLRPTFLNGTYVSTSSSNGKSKSKYVPAHVTTEYCLSFYDNSALTLEAGLNAKYITNSHSPFKKEAINKV